MASLKYKNPETGEWEKVGIGGSSGVTAGQIAAVLADNPEILTSTIKTLFENGSVNTLKSATQITNAVLIESSGAFTGTGKGKLFLNGNNESIVADIIIDGTPLSSVKFSNTGSTIEIEFLESFSVSNKSNSYYIYANAVFY